MGYAGYVSAKYPPPKPTEAEAAVQAVKSEAALEVIGKLLYNAAVAPRDDKFRRARGGPPHARGGVGCGRCAPGHARPRQRSRRFARP
jgi:hypothetical protein